MDDPKACLRTAIRLLTQRDHSRLELSNKLADRGYARTHIEKAIDECVRLAYLDDTRFASGYAEQLQKRGYGCRRMRQMLMAKGLNVEVIDTSLEACCRDEVQYRDCREAAVKKLKGNPGVGNVAKLKSKLYRFLFSRGFSTAIVMQVLDDVLGGGRP